MGDIAKGVLGGAWTLVVGWVLPAALNVGVLAFAVVPALRDVEVVRRAWPGVPVGGGPLALLLVSVMVGLVLSALQNPLYRVLEGYFLWPGRVYAWGCARNRRTKSALEARLSLVRQDARLSAVQRGVLRERLARYPVDEAQVAPTRLGNAIRRFEEYGWDRFRLDTQVFWNELTATAPVAAVRQVGMARAHVDFFVALSYGHVAVAAAAVAVVCAGESSRLVPGVTAVVLSGLVPVWYRAAVAATDEWSAAVRALVNVGRMPLARSLGLVLPAELAEERAMWGLAGKLSRLAYQDRAAALDRFRVDPSAPECPHAGRS